MSTNKTFANRINLSFVIMMSLVGLMASVVTILTNIEVYAAGSHCTTANGETICSNAATASVTVTSACTLTATGGGIYSTTLQNGQVKEIAGSRIKVVCNDSESSALYAIGYSNDEFGNNRLINVIDATLSIQTGLAGPNSYWAMRLSPVTSAYTPTITNSFDSKHLVPGTHELAAVYPSRTNIADESAVDAFYEIGASTTQAAGTYSGKVKYTLVHPSTGPAPVSPLNETDCPANSICYAPNVNDLEGSMSSIGTLSISPTGGKQSVTANSEATLISANYKRNGYGLAGWSTVYEAVPGTDKIYGPNETISTDPGNGGVDVSTNGLILYPVWIASAGNIQNWNGCSDLAVGAVTALRDLRDDNVYTVAKLADDNCWMTENLRLDAENSTNASLAEGYGEGFVGLPNSENSNFTYGDEGGTANNLYNLYYWELMPRYNNNNTNALLEPDYNGTNNSWYSYGNYYTWAAAMANITPTASETSGTSICPAGWKLPTSGASDKNFNLLDKALDGTGSTSNNSSTPTGTIMSKKYRTFPNNFVYSGSFNISSAGGRSSHGYYWSRSTQQDGSFAYYMNISSETVSPSGYAMRCGGNSIRCIINP